MMTTNYSTSQGGSTTAMSRTTSLVVERAGVIIRIRGEATEEEVVDSGEEEDMAAEEDISLRMSIVMILTITRLLRQPRKTMAAEI